MRLVNPIVRRWLDDGLADPEAFWARAARELPWFRPWDRAFDWEPPTFRWFIGGETNLACNALDHHVRARARRARRARRRQRARRAARLHLRAAALTRSSASPRRCAGIGIGKGDRITIYMPTCPEAIMLMLATVRIGAIHSVVFAGFGASALGDRIAASGSRLVFTADVTYRKGKDVAAEGDRRRGARGRAATPSSRSSSGSRGSAAPRR